MLPDVPATTKVFYLSKEVNRSGLHVRLFDLDSLSRSDDSLLSVWYPTLLTTHYHGILHVEFLVDGDCSLLVRGFAMSSILLSLTLDSGNKNLFC
jgi:hypothetical protein